MPNLTYFCELEAQALWELLSPAVLDELSAQSARVSLGMLDLTSMRAAAVRRLNEKKIPVTAWLLLPKEQGYWFNTYNSVQAQARYQAFRSWAERYELVFDRVGLDFEPDIRDLQTLRGNPVMFAGRLLGRLLNWPAVWRARRAYRALVAQIHRDGREVESYQIPMMVEERLARSTLLQRLVGLTDVPVDRDVTMLYTSMVRPHGPGILTSYIQQTRAVGLGVTGGGVQWEGMPYFAPLTWDELSRDLRLAYSWVNDIYIFSLEGCVAQGYLNKLRMFVWDQPILLPETGKTEADAWRGTLVSALWLAERLPLFAVGSVLIWKLVRRWRRSHLAAAQADL